MWTLEFELPLVSFIFILMLNVVYFTKKKVNLLENKLYEVILISSLVLSFLDTILHFNGATHTFNQLINQYYAFANIMNKVIVILFIIIFSSLFGYVMLITYERIKSNWKKYFFPVAIVDFVCFVFLMFTNIEIIRVGSVTNVTGSTIVMGYTIVAIYLLLSLIISIINIKKFDKRYLTIFMILPVLGIFYVLTIVFPGIIIYDLILALLCYFMYFTIENPDVKMIEQLQVARDQADKANRAKTDFLSSMSHEIRTPLNAIVGFSDCIMEAETLGEAKENAHDIVNASQTLLEIVNGILDISKIEAGKIEIVNSKYNAFETFNELAKLITPKMREKGLDFSFNIADDLPTTLYGDHANLKKIVTNLLSNACKYTDRGFVHYEVNCVNSKGVSKLIISVEDSGRGIKKENIDKMFTKFQRLDEDRNTTIEGTGLGLAITKQLIELMGGRIIVHTVYGEGSKFTVIVNQRIEKPDLKDTKKVKTTLDLHDVRILLVDDTALNLKVACKLLERYGANQVITCDNGFDCLEKIRRGEVYDLILLDDMMPKMSGVETLKKLKEIPGFKVPTIALTANAISGMREKYLADGFDDYLAKPIEKDQLIQVINQVLGRSVTEELSVIPNEEINKLPISSEVVREEIIPVDEMQEDRNAVIPITDEDIDVTTELDKSKLEEVKLEAEEVKIDHIEDIETLEETSPVEEVSEVKPIDLVPVVDIDIPTESFEKVGRDYLESHGCDVNHALELLGDMEMYNMTINDFMSEVEAKWEKIVTYKNSGDMENYAIEVHSLKSDCKYLGFMALADIAYEHELKSKENDVSFVNDNFERLETEYKKVLEVARTYVEANPVSE